MLLTWKEIYCNYKVGRKKSLKGKGVIMEYLFLGIAIAGELLGTTMLKYSSGFTKILPATGSILAYIVSFVFLAKSLDKINFSIAYATWSALGILVTTIISVAIFKEKITLVGVGGLVLIVIGVVILNFFGGVSKA
ncbi:MAG: multidrug efflux SMR transporter [Herbinix sp.]|nr:multidrug efflux SMR transporter [Herbinix sp.]